MPAAAASSSTLRSPWASRSSSSSRAGLASALPTRANWSYRAIFRACSSMGSLSFQNILEYRIMVGELIRPVPGGPVSYARDHLIPLVDEGLGNSAYLAGLGGGRALAADTHLHADFLSGAVQLAADEGATVLASAAGRRAFPHTALADGDEADLGGLTLRALATPGHTDEHLSYLLLDEARELGVFTGGSARPGRPRLRRPARCAG